MRSPTNLVTVIFAHTLSDVEFGHEEHQTPVVWAQMGLSLVLRNSFWVHGWTYMSHLKAGWENCTPTCLRLWAMQTILDRMSSKISFCDFIFSHYNQLATSWMCIIAPQGLYISAQIPSPKGLCMIMHHINSKCLMFMVPLARLAFSGWKEIFRSDLASKGTGLDLTRHMSAVWHMDWYHASSSQTWGYFISERKWRERNP